MALNDLRHLTLAGGVVRDDAEEVDGAGAQVVVHQTDGALARQSATALARLARRFEVNHFLHANFMQHNIAIADSPLGWVLMNSRPSRFESFKQFY